MKFFHLADLHLGKKVNEFSMVEDQKYILQQILGLVEEHRPDAVVLAGDVYDKSVPTVEAVDLLDWFLTELAGRKVPVLLISGNHDSADRLSFGAKLMEQSGVMVAKAFRGTPEPVVLQDAFGPVNFYLLPFVKPVMVRAAYAGEEGVEDLKSYQEAVQYVVDAMQVNPEERNVLVAHQLVTAMSLGSGAAELERSDSEEVSVGGVENVDFSTFDAFDYVALGHIHGPQRVGRDTVRYAGTPLKYSFSEVKHNKSVTVVELGEKGKVELSTLPLTPLHDMAVVTGTYEDLTGLSPYTGDAADYLRVILTNEQDIPDVMNKLRLYYPNIMKLEYNNTRTRVNQEIEGAERVEEKKPLDLFAELYEKQNNTELDEEQSALVQQLIERIWEEEA